MTALIALALAAALSGSPCSDDETINLFTAWQDACPVNQPVEPATTKGE